METKSINVSYSGKSATDADRDFYYIVSIENMAHIGRLREKMKERAKNPKFIKTVWGVGYTIEK